MPLCFSEATAPAVNPGPLGPLAASAAEKLKASKHTVAVYESTTGGLMQAALMSVSGSSGYMLPGTVTYSAKKATLLLGADLSEPKPIEGYTGAEYIESKKRWTAAVARRMRGETDATWAVCEAGACGPTFNVSDGMTRGFTVVFVSG